MTKSPPLPPPTSTALSPFPPSQAYQITEQGLQAGLTPAQIQANGGGASQFTLIAGNPLASVNYFDLEPYVEDDWKARPNLTISGGLRFETQDHIHDHADFAPRVGIAWGLGRGKSAKTVLRAGFGVFYDRFGESYILNAERLNGINQQEYIVPSPDFFPTIPPVSTLSASLAYAHDLSNCSQSAHALHHPGRDRAGAASYQESSRSP